MKRLIGSIIILCLGYALNVETGNKFNYNVLNSKKSYMRFLCRKEQKHIPLIQVQILYSTNLME